MPRKARSSKDKEISALVTAVKSMAVSKPRRRARAGGVVSGRGFYRGFGRQAGTIIGGTGGAVLGSKYGGMGGALAGSKLGGYMGGHVGDMAERLALQAMGRGRYRINYNSIIGNVPAIRNSRGREGATIVRHKEYIGDVLSSTTFNLQYNLPINAAQASTFPWLSQIASQYEQYEIQGALFEFVSASGDTTSGSTALGEVVMATQYNALEPPFANKQQMLNQEFAVSAKPSINSIHPIECAPKQTTLELLYTRPGAPATSSDIRLYDLGNFQLATVGQQADGQNLGELYVTYEVCLMKPKLATGAGLGASGISSWTITNPGQNGYPFGDNSSGVPVELYNDFDLSITKSHLTFPKGTVGTYKVDCWWIIAKGNPWAAFRATTPTPNGPNLWGIGTENEYFPSGDTGTGDYQYSFTMEFPTPLSAPQDVYLTGPAIPGSEQWTAGNVIVTQLSYPL